MFGKKPPSPMPPWLKWGVIGFIAIALGMQIIGIHPPAVKTKAGWGLPSLDTYKSRLMPGYGRLQMHDITPGNGAQAVCGQDVEIHYTESPIADTKAATSPAPETKTLAFRLGSADAPETLQESVLGMHGGGKREALVPKERNSKEQTPLRYTIELIKAEPELPQPEKPSLELRVFDRQIGLSRELHCGSEVKAQLVIWDITGKKLLDTHESHPVTFTLGAGPMLGLDIGLLGMQADGSRTLIIPPHLQKPLRQDKDSAVQMPEALAKLPLPEHQPILVDIDLTP